MILKEIGIIKFDVQKVLMQKNWGEVNYYFEGFNVGKRI